MAVYYGGLVLQPSAANRALSLLGLPGERDDVAGALKEVKDQAGLQLREPFGGFRHAAGLFLRHKIGHPHLEAGGQIGYIVFPKRDAAVFQKHVPRKQERDRISVRQILKIFELHQIHPFRFVIGDRVAACHQKRASAPGRPGIGEKPCSFRSASPGSGSALPDP